MVFSWEVNNRIRLRLSDNLNVDDKLGGLIMKCCKSSAFQAVGSDILTVKPNVISQRTK